MKRTYTDAQRLYRWAAAARMTSEALLEVSRRAKALGQDAAAQVLLELGGILFQEEYQRTLDEGERLLNLPEPVVVAKTGSLN